MPPLLIHWDALGPPDPPGLGAVGARPWCRLEWCGGPPTPPYQDIDMVLKGQYNAIGGLRAAQLLVGWDISRPSDPPGRHSLLRRAIPVFYAPGFDPALWQNYAL